MLSIFSEQVEVRERSLGVKLSLLALQSFIAGPFVWCLGELLAMPLHRSANLSALSVESVLSGLGAGFVADSLRISRCGTFVFLPWLFVFAVTAYDVYSIPEPDPFQNLFGPKCQATECLYTLPTGWLITSGSYSIMVFILRSRRRRLDIAKEQNRSL